jgi:hypothetical protein
MPMAAAAPTTTTDEAMFRSVSNAIARSLVAFQRSGLPLAEATVVSVTPGAPDRTRCAESMLTSSSELTLLTTPAAEALAADPTSYNAAAILHSLRSVDTGVLADVVTLSLEQCLRRQWNAWGVSLSDRLRALIEARLRTRIHAYLSAKPHPVLIMPCAGQPVTQVTVTMAVAGDLAHRVVSMVVDTEEFGALAAALDSTAATTGGGGGASFCGASTSFWWWLAVLLLCILLVQCWHQRSTIQKACQRKLAEAAEMMAAAGHHASSNRHHLLHRRRWS